MSEPTKPADQTPDPMMDATRRIAEAISYLHKETPLTDNVVLANLAFNIWNNTRPQQPHPLLMIGGSPQQPPGESQEYTPELIADFHKKEGVDSYKLRQAADIMDGKDGE